MGRLFTFKGKIRSQRQDTFEVTNNWLDIFLSDYWSWHLGIKPKTRNLQTPLPPKEFDINNYWERMKAFSMGSSADIERIVIKKPDSLDQLRQILKEISSSQQLEIRIKAVGSKLAYSQVGFADKQISDSFDSFLIETKPFLHGVRSGKDVDPLGVLKDSVDKNYLCTAEAGATQQIVENHLWPLEQRAKGRIISEISNMFRNRHRV